MMVIHMRQTATPFTLALLIAALATTSAYAQAPAGAVYHFRADQGVQTVGGPDAPGNLVTQWDDQTVPAYNAATPNVNDRPLLLNAANGINGNRSISFDGVDDLLFYPSAIPAIFADGTNYTQKLFLAVFETSANTVSRQFIYDQGGSQQGFNLYLEGGNLYFGIWNRGVGEFGEIFLSTPVDINTAYVAAIVFDSSGGTVDFRLNGSSISGAPVAVTSILAGTDNPGGIGDLVQNTRLHTASNASTANLNVFSGEIAELLQYNTTSVAADAEDYLLTKYDLAPPVACGPMPSYPGGYVEDSGNFYIEVQAADGLQQIEFYNTNNLTVVDFFETIGGASLVTSGDYTALSSPVDCLNSGYRGDGTSCAGFELSGTPVTSGFVQVAPVVPGSSSNFFLLLADSCALGAQIVDLDPVLSLASDEVSVPNAYTLDQNYPNPFNPSTTIRFQLPEASNVRLSVHDLLGREVTTLVSQPMSAGAHEVSWNGRDAAGRLVATGVYLYRIEAGDFMQVKQMMLAK